MGALIRQPFIGSQGGEVTAPFSYEVFLNASDEGVVRLLAHYSGRERGYFDILEGGEREVGWQLHEASSRHPTRFLKLLKECWAELSESPRDDILGGVAIYLAHRYGNLQSSENWEPVENPDALILVHSILDELERHFILWKSNRSAAKALKACAHVIRDIPTAERLTFLALGFSILNGESDIHKDSSNLVTTGLNMRGGDVAESLMILVSNFKQHEIEFPELLVPALRRFASIEHRAIKALILRRLPYLQGKDANLGWELFHRVIRDGVGLWKIAEPCLYYAYHNQFETVAPLLECIYREGNNKDMETWGRISALSALTGHIDFENLLVALDHLDTTEAWQGAASVWTYSENIRSHRGQCLVGIQAGLASRTPIAAAVAGRVNSIFRDNSPPIVVPIELVRQCFKVFENDTDATHRGIYGFNEWLVATAQHDPDAALAITEIYLSYPGHLEHGHYDYKNRIAQLLTRLFSEAEEREESDCGAMLERVVLVQDLLLALGVNSINDWLKGAERQ